MNWYPYFYYVGVFRFLSALKLSVRQPGKLMLKGTKEEVKCPSAEKIGGEGNKRRSKVSASCEIRW